MKQKTIGLAAFEISGQRLIWALHKVLTGKALDIYSADWQRVLKTHSYITDWGKAGPLIEKYRITIEYAGPKDWCAYAPERDALNGGSTPLEAITRCIIDQHANCEAIHVPEDLPS